MKKDKVKNATVDAIDEDGNVDSYIMTEADDDWLRAGRLKRAADAGDKDAAKRLKAMESTELIVI